MSRAAKGKPARSNKGAAVTTPSAVELTLPGAVSPLALPPPPALTFEQCAAAGTWPRDNEPEMAARRLVDSGKVRVRPALLGAR
jgi:hypothetical protein